MKPDNLHDCKVPIPAIRSTDEDTSVPCRENRVFFCANKVLKLILD